MANQSKIKIPGIWLTVYEALRGLKRLEIKWAASLLFFLLPLGVWASDVSVTAKGGAYLPTDKELQSGYSVQADLNWKVFYLFGQYIETERRIAGQRAGTTDIWGFGLGMKVPVGDYVKAWGQMGYYHPTTDLVDGSKYEESHWLYWRKWGTNHNYDVGWYTHQYNYKIQGGFGGALGIDLLYPISKHLILGFSAGYQALKFHETFYARSKGWTQGAGWIQTIQDKNYSGFILEVEATWRF